MFFLPSKAIRISSSPMSLTAAREAAITAPDTAEHNTKAFLPVYLINTITDISISTPTITFIPLLKLMAEKESLPIYRTAISTAWHSSPAVFNTNTGDKNTSRQNNIPNSSAAMHIGVSSMFAMGEINERRTQARSWKDL